MRPIKASDLGIRTVRRTSGGLMAGVAKGQPLKTPAGMNGLEIAYADLLDEHVRIGTVRWWKYEAMTLKLADETRYTPDFAVMLANGDIECHETKGYMREAGRVRLNVAAAQYPFRFWLIKRLKGGAWEITKV